MVIEIDEGFEISTYFNNEVITLYDSYNWSIWLSKMKKLSRNTIKSVLFSMEKFWIYSLYLPPNKNQKFASFLAEYRFELLKGITIKLRKKDSIFNDYLNIPILELDPKSKKTINKEIRAINLYFEYTEENDLVTNSKYINYAYENKLSSKSFLSSIEIKKSNSYLKAYGKRKKYLTPFKTIKESGASIKYFPLALFDELLKVSAFREQLIYILCGICSARLGQALNLTLYDIDYKKFDIWLLSPNSDLSHCVQKKSRRKWLMEEYNIDAMYTQPHCGSDLQFKYPIPLNHEALYWLDEDKYKKSFFELLIKYQKSDKYLHEAKRFPSHPFLFVTKTGNRLRARSVQKSFEVSIEKLKKKFPKYDLNGLSIHSLRHMFGHALAEHYANTGDESLIYVCQNAMGHKCLDSTLIYFKMSTNTIRNKLKNVSENLFKKEVSNEKR